MEARTRTSPLLVAAAVVALVPVLLAGCSHRQADSSGAASANDVASGTGAPDTADCLRAEGYDIDEPMNGVQTLDAPDGVDEEQWRDDLERCSAADGAGEGFSASSLMGTPEQRRDLAACIRAAGFPDYPDDDDALSRYRPSDPETFAEVASTCSEDVFGPGPSTQRDG